MLEFVIDWLVVLSRFGLWDPYEDEILRGHVVELEDFGMRTAEKFVDFEN